MSSDPTPDVPAHHAELAHFAAAAVAAMSVVPLLASTRSLGKEPGTASWGKWLFALLLVALAYLLSVAFTHLGEAWRGADQRPTSWWRTLLRAAVDATVAAAAINLLLRGPESRILLSGLGDALPGLAVAGSVSAVIGLYSRSREAADPTMQPAARPARGIFHVLAGLVLVGGLIVCELQPLPRIVPAIETERATSES